LPDEKDWREFIGITGGQPAWPRLVRAAALFETPGEALDLGAGGGRDSRHLLSEGWRVTAVDSSPSSAAALRRLPRQRNLQFVSSRIEDFVLESYDLVNAQFSLPFMARDRYEATLRGIRDAVRPGGVLAATFFGQRDQWNEPGSEVNFTTQTSVRALFAGWELIELAEVEEDGQTADGTPKHWHVFHVIARRRPSGVSDQPAG
jgi:SAM-dependent methyltransferase